MIWHPELSVILSEIPESCTVHKGVFIGKNVKIGERVKIQADAFIPDGVTLEDDVFIGPKASFANDKYPPSNGNWVTSLVCKGASIGINATILPVITIGVGSVVGGGAVVTKDIPDGETWVGNPAKKLNK